MISPPSSSWQPRAPRRLRALLLACALAAVCGPGFAAPPSPPEEQQPLGFDLHDPPQGVLVDDWYAVMIHDMEGKLHKSGYAQVRMERQGNEIVTRSLVQLDFRRGLAAVAMAVEEVNRETVDAQPLAFSFAMTAAKQVVRTEGRVSDGRVTIVTTQADRELKVAYDYPEGALMAWGLFRECQGADRSPGQKHKTLAYVPSIRPDQGVDVSYEFAGQEMIDLFGRRRQAQRVEQCFEFGAAFFKITTWMDQAGTVLVQDLPISFLNVRMIKCPEAIARQPGEPPEIFQAAAVKLNKPIDRRKARSVTFTLRLTEADGTLPDLPDTGLQTPERVDEQTVRLAVTRQEHAALARARRVMPPAELRNFLRSTIYVDVTDPLVKEMAKQAAQTADHDSPYAMADALRRYVSTVIDQKTLNVGYATASEVARSKEGDCSEHAVLLVALARANGLPARAVSGLVGVDQGPGSNICEQLNYHMWTQVWMDGVWVDLDAAQHQTDCDPTHIALSVMPLTSNVVIEDELLNVLQVIGQLDITAQDVE